MSETKTDQTEIGALWKKEGRSQKFLAGSLTLKNLTEEQIQQFVKTKELPVVIFTNKFKQKDTHPDLRVYLSKPKNEASAPRPTRQASAEAPQPAAGDAEII